MAWDGAGLGGSELGFRRRGDVDEPQERNPCLMSRLRLKDGSNKRSYH